MARVFFVIAADADADIAARLKADLRASGAGNWAGALAWAPAAGDWYRACREGMAASVSTGHREGVSIVYPSHPAARAC